LVIVLHNSENNNTIIIIIKTRVSVPNMVGKKCNLNFGLDDFLLHMLNMKVDVICIRLID